MPFKTKHITDISDKIYAKISAEVDESLYVKLAFIFGFTYPIPC
jgi:hypothetical protein